MSFSLDVPALFSRRGCRRHRHGAGDGADVHRDGLQADLLPRQPRPGGKPHGRGFGHQRQWRRAKEGANCIVQLLGYVLIWAVR